MEDIREHCLSSTFTGEGGGSVPSTVPDHPEGGVRTCPILYLLARARDPLLVKLMHINCSAKLCCPGGHACVEMGVRNGYRLDVS